MSGNVLFFLAAMLLVGLTSAKPKQVPNANLQCQKRSTGEYTFKGACALKPINGINVAICKNLICARAMPSCLYGAYKTGPAEDGTHCGPSMACRNGQCKKWKGVPIQLGPMDKYICQKHPLPTPQEPTD